MSDFDIQGARNAGYSDAEIADYLGKQGNFDVGGARKSGYSDADIIGHLSPAAASPAPQAREPVAASAVFNNRPMTVVQPQPQQPAAPPAPSKPWTDVAIDAVKHIPESAGNFVNALAQPILHPVDTYNGLQRIAGGLVTPPEWLVGKETPEEKAARIAPANAVGKYFSDRYGSMEGFKNALSTDPVGVAADVSAPLTMGGSTLARAPGIVGKVGEIAQTAGRVTDPVNAIVQAPKVASKIAEPIMSTGLGMTTGSGASSVRNAARAGAEGGENAEAFQKAMRGNSTIDNTVGTARQAIDQVRADAGKEYRSGMQDISKDRSILDFGDINKAVDKASAVGSFKGAKIEPKAADINSELRQTISDWENLNPKAKIFKDVPEADLTPENFHTPEGLDALKHTIGNIRSSTQYGTPERVAADRVYNAVKAEIVKQAPVYGAIMERYGDAADKVNEVTRTLSLGEKATGDTAGRKLLSATRDGANTNYGQRAKLIDELAQKEPTLPYAIAGHAMNALAPQGVIGRGGLTAMVLTNPLGFLKAPAFSPRVVGEGAYYAGKAAGMGQNALRLMRVNEANARRVGRGAYQAGRLQEVQ